MDNQWTSEEFVSAFIDDLKISYKNLEQQEQINGGSIDSKALLLLLDRFLSVLQQIVTIEGHSLTYNQDELITTNKSMAFLELMTFGGQLVYQIRTLLLKETIDYILGGQGNDGLHSEMVKQSVILDNIKADLKQGAVLLDKVLEDVNNLTKVEQHIDFLWQQIQSLSAIDFDNQTAMKDVPIFAYTYTTKTGKQRNVYRHYYQKPSPDYNVFLRYNNLRTKKIKYSYYNLQGNMVFFNDGWLYEWFSEYINQENGYKKLATSLNKKSLSVMMQKTDTTPGYKGGDFQIGKQQIQAKFGNLKVISFKSIITVLTSLKDILIQYNTEDSEQKKDEAILKVAQLFSAHNIQKINEKGEDIGFKALQETLKNTLK